MHLIFSCTASIAGTHLNRMKNEYLKPMLRIVDLRFDKAFCLSDVPGTGGSTSDWGEDDETLFN